MSRALPYLYRCIALRLHSHVAFKRFDDRVGAWALYRLAEAQGLVDLLLVGSAAPDESPQEFLHLLVCADLSRRSEDFGLSVDPFPQRYR